MVTAIGIILGIYISTGLFTFLNRVIDEHTCFWESLAFGILWPKLLIRAIV